MNDLRELSVINDLREKSFEKACKFDHRIEKRTRRCLEDLLDGDDGMFGENFRKLGDYAAVGNGFMIKRKSEGSSSTLKRLNPLVSRKALELMREVDNDYEKWNKLTTNEHTTPVKQTIKNLKALGNKVTVEDIWTAAKLAIVTITRKEDKELPQTEGCYESRYIPNGIEIVALDIGAKEYMKRQKEEV